MTSFFLQPRVGIRQACIKLHDYTLTTTDHRIYLFFVETGKPIVERCLTIPDATRLLSLQGLATLNTGSILILCSTTGNEPTRIIVVKGPNVRPGDRLSDSWSSVLTFARGPLTRMLSHSLGNMVFSPDPNSRMRFWNLIRGRIAADRRNLEWLISYCRRRFFGGVAQPTPMVTDEDLIEHLLTDTVVCG